MYVKRSLIRKVFSLAGYKARKFAGFKKTNRVITHAVNIN